MRYRLLYGPPTRADVAILTALEVELRAVCAHLDLRGERQVDGWSYQTGNVEAPNARWNVVATMTGAGDVPAATATARMIETFTPMVVLFVGVAGGIKDVELGDVVVASKVYGYDRRKEDKDGVRTRPEFGQPHARLIDRARHLALTDTWTRASPPARGANALVAPIAVGAAVVADEDAYTAQLVRKSFSDAVAVEMEGYGFLYAAWQQAALERANAASLVIRGISDLLSGKEEADQSGSQERASANAAAFAFDLLGTIQVEV